MAGTIAYAHAVDPSLMNSTAFDKLMFLRSSGVKPGADVHGSKSIDLPFICGKNLIQKLYN